MPFHERLRELRGKKKCSQKIVAEALGIDRTTYTKYETGKSEPDLETTQKLADFFDVSVDSLLGRDEKPKNEPKEMIFSEKEMQKIKEESNRLRGLMMTSLGIAFDGEIKNDDTLKKVMMALEEGMILAKKEVREKYTPKSIVKKKQEASD